LVVSTLLTLVTTALVMRSLLRLRSKGGAAND